MLTTYSDYNRDRIGWFFGLSGWQLAVLAASALPVFGCLQRGAWSAALLFAARMAAGADHRRGPGPGPVGDRLVPGLDRRSRSAG